MMRDILTWFFKSVGVFLLGIPVTLLGGLMVALALPFRTIHDGRSYNAKASS